MDGDRQMKQERKTPSSLEAMDKKRLREGERINGKYFPLYI